MEEIRTVFGYNDLKSFIHVIFTIFNFFLFVYVQYMSDAIFLLFSFSFSKINIAFYLTSSLERPNDLPYSQKLQQHYCELIREKFLSKTFLTFSHTLFVTVINLILKRLLFLFRYIKYCWLCYYIFELTNSIWILTLKAQQV